MIWLVKLKILTPLQKLPKNVRDLGKLIVANGFEKLPKVWSWNYLLKMNPSHRLFFKNGSNPASFCLFSSFHMTNREQIWLQMIKA